MGEVAKEPLARTFESVDLLLGAVVLYLYNPLALRDSVLCLLQLFVQLRGPHVQSLEFSHCLRYISSVYIQFGAEQRRESEVM